LEEPGYVSPTRPPCQIAGRLSEGVLRARKETFEAFIRTSSDSLEFELHLLPLNSRLQGWQASAGQGKLGVHGHLQFWQRRILQFSFFRLRQKHESPWMLASFVPDIGGEPAQAAEMLKCDLPLKISPKAPLPSFLIILKRPSRISWFS